MQVGVTFLECGSLAIFISFSTFHIVVESTLRLKQLHIQTQLRELNERVDSLAVECMQIWNFHNSLTIFSPLFFFFSFAVSRKKSTNLRSRLLNEKSDLELFPTVWVFSMLEKYSSCRGESRVEGQKKWHRHWWHSTRLSEADVRGYQTTLRQSDRGNFKAQS